MDRNTFFTRLEKASRKNRQRAYSSPVGDFFGISGLFNIASSPVPVPVLPADDLANWALALIKRPATSGLNPYSAALTEQQVSHLFKRTCYGAAFLTIKANAGSTADTLVNMLFQDYTQPADPVNMSADEIQTDALKPWLNATGSFVNGGRYTAKLNGQRDAIVGNMWNDQIIGCGLHIREKIVVFLSSYLVVQNGAVQDARLFYRYLRLLRNFASTNGTLPNSPAWNFKELIKQLTIEPAMLMYLNGDGSTAGAPNENYGRELQELFTIGKGPQTTTGDYTTYSEQDVQAAAHVLTGWTVQGFKDRQQDNTLYTNPPIAALFTPASHDNGTKKFSADYANTTVGPSSATDQTAGKNEINALVEMIFAQEATAENIVSRLYRTFVYYYIDDKTNTNIIKPLANLFRTSYNYDLSLVLKTLLKSEHFFDTLNVGCIIKDPVMFVAIAQHNFGFTTGDVIGAAGSMLMSLGNPSEVAGWKGTYQAPNYHEWWISTITVDARTLYTAGRNGVEGGFIKNNIPAIKALVEDSSLVSDPTDPNILITELARHFFPSELYNDAGKPYPGPITAKELLLLKGILIPGQPDFEWNAQIYSLRNTPAVKPIYEAHLVDLLHYMFSMAEYYLC